jgi:hypothetical protein
MFFFRIAGLATFTCLFFLGLVRIILDIFPYQFHALNHNVLLGILLPFILGVPFSEISFQFLTCGHACDSVIKHRLVGLYQANFDLKDCATTLVWPILLCLIAITYAFVICLEYKRKRNIVQPIHSVGRPQHQLQLNGRPIAGVDSVSGQIEQSRNSLPQVTMNFGSNTVFLVTSILSRVTSTYGF